MNIGSRIAGLLLCTYLTATPVFAQSPPNERASAGKAEVIEKEVLRLEEVGRQKVLRGDNNWDDLIAADAYMIAFDGSIIIYKRGQQLPSMPVKSFEMTEMIARVYGEVVVVTGLAEVASETPQKQPFSYKMRFLNVWERFDGGWKIVVSERTGVKQPPK
jgi:ketosteroid isomerase-like protein